MDLPGTSGNCEPWRDSGTYQLVTCTGVKQRLQLHFVKWTTSSSQRSLVGSPSEARGADAENCLALGYGR
jgi:hypothetical protein